MKLNIKKIHYSSIPIDEDRSVLYPGTMVAVYQQVM